MTIILAILLLFAAFMIGFTAGYLTGYEGGLTDKELSERMDELFRRLKR